MANREEGDRGPGWSEGTDGSGRIGGWGGGWRRGKGQGEILIREAGALKGGYIHLRAGAFMDRYVWEKLSQGRYV